jgi:hypothetical protein
MTQKFLHKRLVRRLISEAGRARKAEARRRSGGERAIVSGRARVFGCGWKWVWSPWVGYSGAVGTASDVLSRGGAPMAGNVTSGEERGT